MKVSLTPIDGGEPIASLLTSKGGSYKFENLLTGSVGHLEIFHKDQKAFPSICSLCTSSENNLNPSPCVCLYFQKAFLYTLTKALSICRRTGSLGDREVIIRF